MNKQALDQAWGQTRQKYGIYLRLLEAIPEDRFHTQLVPGIRTPAEMVVHTSGTVIRDIAQGVAKGRITTDESGDGKAAAELKTKAAVIAFARQCWDQANAAVATISDGQLAAMVQTPWNMTFPGSVGFAIQNDEFVHHRGQFYCFVRLCGVEPPSMYSFGENAPEFR